LCALGIEARAGQLARNASSTQREAIGQALRRLTASDEMGSLFKVLGITPPGSEPPAGFA
ncbi:MAG: class I SAM-dependent methyltransferase, partial [Parvibaculaceae bacterium]